MIKKTGFTASSSPTGEREYGKISKKDIVNLNDLKFTHTLVGNGDRRFISSTTSLKVKNYGKYLANVLTENKHVRRLNELLVGYPIILFTFGGETIFFGDGSPCIDYHSYMAAKEQKDNSVIGFSGFQITSAYDLKGDGFPDIIVVNDELVYFIDSDGKVYVLSVGITC